MLMSLQLIVVGGDDATGQQLAHAHDGAVPYSRPAIGHGSIDQANSFGVDQI